MKKRILSCVLVLVMMAALLPASAFQAIAGVTQYGRIDIVMSTLAGNIPYINATFKTAPSEVKIALAPAGTKPDDVLTATRYEMFDSFGSWQYNFASADTILDMGDFNIWFFIDGSLEPITDNRCWRVIDGNVHYNETFNGLDPSRAYAKVTDWTTTTFTLTAYSVIPNKTYFELVRREDKTVAQTITITKAGSVTYTLPNLTGTYILRYTRDDKTRDIAYLSLLGGTLPLNILGNSTKSKLEPSVSNGSIEGWRKGENSLTGSLKADVSVANEDFDYPTELYLRNKDTDAESLLARSFESGALGANVTVKTDSQGKWINGGKYTFDITIAKPADGTYLLRVKRGTDIVDIWQFELFNGVLYGMDPGETPIKPLSVDNPALANEYCRIFILGESFEATGTSFFSLDGGKKWQPISKMADYEKRNANTGQLASSKIFDKGFELWFSDTAPSGKSMPDSAKLIKFPKVGKRPNGPKLEVNYQLAHMGSDGVLNFECYDDNLWVPVKKGTTEILSGGYIYRYGGLKETNRGDLKQTGKPDWEDRAYELTSEGIPIPESNEDNGGIKYSETSDKISYKSIKENYFVSAVPYFQDGVYYPASKPVKLAVSSYLKPKPMKINYSKETLKLVAGAVFIDIRIYNGVVPVEVAKSKTSGVISVTEILNGDSLNGDPLNGDYQIAPTAKKPASCPVFWELAYRGDMMELESEMERGKEVNVTENGKFTPSKALEFRSNGSKWGSFKAPKASGTSYEYRTKATAKGGKLMFEGDWFMIDSIIFKKEDEEEVWAAGEIQTFEYRWGTNYNTKNGKAATKAGVEWTNIS